MRFFFATRSTTVSIPCCENVYNNLFFSSTFEWKLYSEGLSSSGSYSVKWRKNIDEKLKKHSKKISFLYSLIYRPFPSPLNAPTIFRRDTCEAHLTIWCVCRVSARETFGTFCLPLPKLIWKVSGFVWLEMMSCATVCICCSADHPAKPFAMVNILQFMDFYVFSFSFLLPRWKAKEEEKSILWGKFAFAVLFVRWGNLFWTETKAFKVIKLTVFWIRRGKVFCFTTVHIKSFRYDDALNENGKVSGRWLGVNDKLCRGKLFFGDGVKANESFKRRGKFREKKVCQFFVVCFSTETVTTSFWFPK